MAKKRSLVPWIILITLICILADGLIYLLISGQEEKMRSATLKDAVEIGIAAIDPNQLVRFSASLNDNSSDYYHLRKQMIDLQTNFSHNGIDSIYAIAQRADGLIFLIDSTPTNHSFYTPPGESYLNPPEELLAAFTSEQPVFAGPYSDEYGKFYSYFQPITDSHGSVIAVFGADIQSHYFTSLLLERASGYFLAVLIIFILFLFILYYNIKSLDSRDAFKEEQVMTERMINAFPDIFYLIDRSGNFLLWNKAFSHYLGYSSADMSKIKFFNLFDDKCREKIDTCCSDAYQQGFGRAEAKMKTKSGKQIFFEFYHTILKDHRGKERGLAGIGHDISERKKREQILINQKKELEEINRLMVGRELKMIEMKNSIKECSQKIKTCQKITTIKKPNLS